MSSGMVFAFMVVMLGIMVGLAVLALVTAHRRREALTAHAALRGWSYTRRDDTLCDAFPGSPFGVGHGRSATNVLRGSHDGRAFLAFDYVYKTTSGSGQHQQTQTHRYSVLAMDTGVVFPRLSVSPEGMLGRLVGRLTNRDIELESEEFNRTFSVTSDHRKFASDVLHPRMMELLLRNPGLAWRFEGGSMLAIRSGHHDTAEVDAKLAALDAILDAVPEFVWREVGGRR